MREDTPRMLYDLVDTADAPSPYPRGRNGSDGTGHTAPPSRAESIRRRGAASPPGGGTGRDEPATMRMIFEHAGVGMFRSTCDGRVLDANPALARMLGYASPGQLMREVEDIGRQVYADPEVRRRLLRTLEADGGVNGLVFQCRRRDGGLIWASLHASVVPDARGRPTCIVGSLADVTELIEAQQAARLAEAEYRGLFEHAPEGIYRSSVDGVFLRANPALVRLMGYADEAELLAALKDIATEWYVVPGRRAEFIETLRAGGRVTNFVSEVYRHGTGERVWVSENARIVHGDDGRLLYFEGTVVDISERKRAEDAVFKAMAEVEASNRAKSAFLANMSHELRTPLNAIIGFSEMIRSDTLGPLSPETRRGYIDDIHASGMHLLQLIEDILDVSKAEAGRLMLEEQPIELGRVFQSGLQMMRERARRGCVRLKWEISADLPLLMADRRRVLQIALNLVSNAVKFTPGGGTVTVRTGMAEDGGMVAAVEDTGIGIEPNQIGQIFDPFVQLNHGSDVAGEGTGLGLPLTRKLVELHGGRLDLASEPGRGTCVTVRFPPHRTLR